VGIFWISRIFTKKGVRILCYHNFGSEDDVTWRPKLFITPKTFLERMQYLKEKGYRVLDLDTALANMEKGAITDLSVVITIDDGWYGVLRHAHPILLEKQFLYTIYVTSYYSKNPVPVYNLAIAYLFHKTSKQKIDLTELGIPEINTVDISNGVKKEHTVKCIIEHGEKKNIAFRQDLLKRTAVILDADITGMLDRRIFHIMQHDQLNYLSDQGVDLQLHTHRHRWPTQEGPAMEELTLNRDYLSSIQKKTAVHFCYPSGFYTENQFPILRKAKIKSATTCEPGLNFPATNPYALKRFLDGENISPIEFEAELSGFLYLLRTIKNKILSVKPKV